jgi:hypothetical protein
LEDNGEVIAATIAFILDIDSFELAIDSPYRLIPEADEKAADKHTKNSNTDTDKTDDDDPLRIPGTLNGRGEFYLGRGLIAAAPASASRTEPVARTTALAAPQPTEDAAESAAASPLPEYTDDGTAAVSLSPEEAEDSPTAAFTEETVVTADVPVIAPPAAPVTPAVEYSGGESSVPTLILDELSLIFIPPA